MMSALCAQVRETDIDTLERCCAAMAYGDLQAEDPCSLSQTNFLRLFRLAQLTVEYLLHIQDRLVWENGILKVCPVQKQYTHRGSMSLHVFDERMADTPWHDADVRHGATAQSEVGCSLSIDGGLRARGSIVGSVFAGRQCAGCKAHRGAAPARGGAQGGAGAAQAGGQTLQEDAEGRRGETHHIPLSASLPPLRRLTCRFPHLTTYTHL